MGRNICYVLQFSEHDKFTGIEKSRSKDPTFDKIGDTCLSDTKVLLMKRIETTKSQS